MYFVDAADIPLEQYEDDNEASGEDTQEDEENNEEPLYTYILHLFICRGLKPRNG